MVFWEFPQIILVNPERLRDVTGTLLCKLGFFPSGFSISQAWEMGLGSSMLGLGIGKLK